MPRPGLHNRVETALRPHRGRGIVVAVSGGADSVALLRLLHDLSGPLALRLSVAHLDHGTRGEASRLDAAFVADLAASLALPFDLGHWRPDRPAHFEADARRARYAWLADVARARGHDLVAVGHTRDDQAETVLHRILRGTGPLGLAGIPPRRDLGGGITLIRPLLNIGRSELREHLKRLDQPFREDASNLDLARTRNRIRHDLLPKLASEYNPRITEALARLGDFARADLRLRLREATRAARRAVVSADAASIVARVAPLASLPAGLRAEALRRLWKEAGWPEGGMTAALWLRLADLCAGTGRRVSLAGGVDARSDGDRLILVRDPATVDGSRADPLRLDVPGVAEGPGGRVVASWEAESPGGERIDADLVAFWTDERGGRSLLVDRPAEGDRFAPLGMGGRTQSLADFLRGRGLKRADREAVLVVRDREGIVWVVGHRIAERVRRTDATRAVLRLSWSEPVELRNPSPLEGEGRPEGPG